MRTLLSLIICLFITPLFANEYSPTVCVFADPQEVGVAAAKKIVEVILDKQQSGKKTIVLGFATGKSPIPTYQAFKKLVREYDLDLSEVITFNLDEYLNLPTTHLQSYHCFMFTYLFNDLLFSDNNPHGIRKENIHIPKGAAHKQEDLSEEEFTALSLHFPHCMQEGFLNEEEQLWIGNRRAQEYEALIAQIGPIDLQILGIGCNGHIGFAEPGTSFESKTMVMALTDQTRKSNACFFEGKIEDVPKFAITMGIKTILQANEILLLSTGEHKADITAKTLKEPISSNIPSTALRLHPHVSFYLDQEAASVPHSPTLKFYNAKILLNHTLQEGELWVRQGKIIASQEKADLSIDVQGNILAPSYIDVQINGGFGCDFSRNPEKIDLVAQLLPQHGVAAFLPTVISSSPDQYRKVLPVLQPRSYGTKKASNLGIHLEGPFFATQYRGAHNEKMICPFFDETSSIEEIYGPLQGVKIVTLAPELPGALQLIKQLREKNIIVSAGHSGATMDQTQKGVAAGIGLVTHLFNAMPSYHHRNPSIVGAALIEPSLYYSVIVDNIHLCPETVDLCWRCNPKGMILISDAIEALGLPQGKYQLGTMNVEVTNEAAYIAGTKTIAGSTLFLDDAVRRLKAITDCSIVDALEAASLKPAQLIQSYPTKGSLEVGADADFLILDEDLFIHASYIAGELAWSKESL